MGRNTQNNTVVATAPVNESVVIKTTIKTINVIAANEGARYRVTFNDSFLAMVKNYDTDVYEEKEVDYINFNPSVLIAQCINHVDGLDIMYTKKKEKAIRNDDGNNFGAAELQVILKGAKLELTRTKFEAGSEYTTKDGSVETHENAGYNTDITKITVSDRIQAKLDEMAFAIFDL